MSEGTREEALARRFTVGELIPWKGCWFRVESVLPNGLLLGLHGFTMNAAAAKAAGRKKKERKDQ